MVVWRKATGVDGEATDDRHTGYRATSWNLWGLVQARQMVLILDWTGCVDTGPDGDPDHHPDTGIHGLVSEPTMLLAERRRRHRPVPVWHRRPLDVLRDGLRVPQQPHVPGGDGRSLDKGPLYARGACTDSFWESSNCPSFCRATGYDVLNGQQVMHRCDNNDLLFYCESRSKPDCEHTQRVIVYSTTPTPQTTITATAQNLGVTGLGTSTGTPASATPTTSNPVAGDSSSSNGAKIGIGVGVTLGVLGLIAGLAALFIVKRRRGRGPNGGSQQNIPVQELPADPILPPASMTASPPPSSPPPVFWPSDCKTPYTPSSITTAEPWSPNRQELPGH
ncbi:hypothetical protein ACCO45_005185 [Purpureocillium lilacinum]|uniref:Uncharacterized protein n=1 Tax=Purpureocillium lilacinum TaxID=33203 RepID=A0ACC4DXS1_PURLI